MNRLVRELCNTERWTERRERGGGVEMERERESKEVQSVLQFFEVSTTNGLKGDVMML